MTTENNKFNGWTNYETFLLYLNIVNDGYYNKYVRRYYQKNFKQDDVITYADAEDFKEDLRPELWKSSFNIYTIHDSFSTREWARINFKEVLEHFKPEQVQ